MSTTTPSDGSRTLTVLDSHPDPDSHDLHSSTPAVLRLRGGPNSRPRVVWREDVIDNENMGKKSSKSLWFRSSILVHAKPRLVCCIYHKTRNFGESSSEDSSSEDDDSDGPLRNHPHHYQHRCHHHSPRSPGDGDGTRMRDSRVAEVEELSSDDEPNAYEKVPGRKKGKGNIKLNGEYHLPGTSSDHTNFALFFFRVVISHRYIDKL
jgi:protein phosphatase 1 regulatory subunit 11